MILATTTVQDVDQFLKVFGAQGAEKRALHGSKGSTVFRDPTEENRVWALFEWDEQGWTAFVSDPEVPAVLKEAGHLSKPQPALLLGSYRAQPRSSAMSISINRPARVGVITDQTGPLSFMGIANANVAKMVIDDINARGGLLGRPVDLFIEDSATEDGVAEAVATKLVEDVVVDVVVGGIYSSTRQAIKGPVVEQAKKLYIYPEQYEGQECHPLIFCTGPVPAQQVEPLFPWLMDQTEAKTFYLPSADYIWPHTLNKKVREVVTARGGSIVGEEYFPMDHTDYDAVVADIMSSGADVVFNTIVPPGLTPFVEQLHAAGFAARGGQIVCTYFDENFLNLVPAEHVEGLYGCLDYYRDVKDPFSTELLNRYEALYPGSAMFTAGSACTGMYRGLKLWEAAVTEAGSLDQDTVIAALDHARLRQGPGGPAEMVPGQHHVRMNMYIARSVGGTFKVVENLGHIDPKECEVER